MLKVISYLRSVLKRLKHNFSVSDDHDVVTISVSNPGGAKDLNLTFTLFSKVPITRAMLTDRDVTTIPENQNYELGVSTRPP